jgi:hypothetical protein
MTIKNRKLPKTHTIFGVKCKICSQTIFHPYWCGENDQFRIQIWERDITYRHPSDKRYLVEITLRTFHQACIDGTGDTLKEAQMNIVLSFTKDLKQAKFLQFHMEDKCNFITNFYA